MENEAFYAITPMGLRRIAITVGNATDPSVLFKDLASRQLVKIKNMIPGCPLTTADNQQIITACRVPSIEINTNWEASVLDGKPVMLPTFDPQRGVGMSMTWVPPCPTYLVVRVLLNGQQEPVFHRDYVWVGLVAKASSGATRLLPLPNLYENGNVCMGSGFYPQNAEPVLESVADLVAYCRTEFNNASWNSDLFDQWKRNAVPHLFAFTPDGVQIPASINWLEHTKPAADTNYTLLEDIH